MKTGIVTLCFLFLLQTIAGQELYVFTEPASNIPAHSLSVKIKDHFVSRDNIYDRFSNRVMPQVMYGVNKKLMVRAGISIANMHTTDTKYESFSVYTKYRFLSKDELHKHFRMAVFAEVSKTRIPFHYDEISMMGDKSGIEAGVIATQLWHKFALSGSVSHTQVLDKSRNNKVLYIPERNYQSVNFSLSGGYLLFPGEYSSYKQTNLNLYLELLGQQTLDRSAYYIDMAPAIQLIFTSNTKMNLGYRFQLGSNMSRMTANSFLVSFERTFLNAFRKNK